MKGMEFLFVIAQVSVVYVGFATLIVVVVQQFSGVRGQVEVARLQGMMLLSLLAVGFSLFPYLLFRLDLADQTVWRISSLLLGALWLCLVVTRLRWLRNKEAATFLTLGNRVNLLFTQPVTIFCLFGAALGLWGELAGFVYLCAIFVLLLVAAYIFTNLVVSMSASTTD